MSNIRPIGKPTVADKTKESLLKVLRDLITEVEAGEVTALVMMSYHTDEKWTNYWSPHLHVGCTIGHLEMTKIELTTSWAREYQRDNR
jgi:hypothetical protein